MSLWDVTKTQSQLDLSFPATGEGGSWFPRRATRGLQRSTCQHTWAPRRDLSCWLGRWLFNGGYAWKMQRRKGWFLLWARQKSPERACVVQWCWENMSIKKNTWFSSEENFVFFGIYIYIYVCVFSAAAGTKDGLQENQAALNRPLIW